MTVEELLQRITAREFSEWMAFDRIDPIGRDRDDWNAASIAHTVAEAHRTRKEPYKLKDFLPQYGKPERPTPEQLSHKIRSIFGALATRRKKPDGNDS